LSSRCGTAVSTEPNLACPFALGRVLARIESLRERVAILLRFGDVGCRLGVVPESEKVVSTLCPRLCVRTGDFVGEEGELPSRLTGLKAKSP
jgi:hypothetical protein